MQPLVYNIKTSDFNRYHEAASLLAAYLLGGRPVIVGDSADEIHLTEHANKLSLFDKLNVLESIHSDDANIAAGIRAVVGVLHQQRNRIVSPIISLKLFFFSAMSPL